MKSDVTFIIEFQFFLSTFWITGMSVNVYLIKN